MLGWWKLTQVSRLAHTSNFSSAFNFPSENSEWRLFIGRNKASENWLPESFRILEQIFETWILVLLGLSGSFCRRSVVSSGSAWLVLWCAFREQSKGAAWYIPIRAYGIWTYLGYGSSFTGITVTSSLSFCFEPTSLLFVVPNTELVFRFPADNEVPAFTYAGVEPDTGVLFICLAQKSQRAILTNLSSTYRRTTLCTSKFFCFDFIILLPKQVSQIDFLLQQVRMHGLHLCLALNCSNSPFWRTFCRSIYLA